MKELYRKAKQNKAFTMVEMLVVVAITVVLLGISVLSISSISTSLTMNELDSHAKTIFLEAQNQLSAVEVAGGLPRLYDELRDGYEARFFDEESDKPSDFDALLLPEENQEDWMNLCYVTKNDEITKNNLILAQSASYQLDGNYVIEFNPQTGDIYGVFYWTTTDVGSYADVIAAVGDRSLSVRNNVQIGYYGGQTMSTEPTNMSLDMNAEFVNEEELYLKISMEKSSRLLRYYRSGALTITCTITDESGHEWIASTDEDYEGADFVIDLNKGVENIDALEFYVLLDSLESGYALTDITVDKDSHAQPELQTSLLPGDNIQAKVECEFKQGAYYCLETDNDNVTNSIFDKKTLTADGATFEINAVRHLLNINKYEQNASLGNKIEIKQTDDIDYTNNDFVWSGGVYTESGYNNPFIATRDASGKPLTYTSVLPIRNSVLFINTGDSDITTIDGSNDAGYEIKNFRILADKEDAGLFAVAENVHFKNLRIEDIVVNAGSFDNVGALAGYIKGGSVENCGVYLTTYTLKEDITKDYYAQQVKDGEIYPNEMVKRYDTYKIIGKENVGGLIGVADGVTVIKDSFAAVKVEGDESVGGFIGYATDMPSGISNCYASGSVVGDVEKIGGFIGHAVDTDVTNAYSTSNIYGNDVFAGFVGFSDGCEYKNCIAYGEILNLSGKTEFPGTVNGFTCFDVATDNRYDGCAYLKQTSYNASHKLEGLVVERKYTDFVADSTDKVGVGNSHPYNAALLYKVFPFAKVVDSHYGDWPAQYSMNTSLVYYEKYKNYDGSYTYGFYCESKLTSKEELDPANDYVWVLDSLQNRECVEDGYALLSTHNLDSFKYDLSVGSGDAADAPVDYTAKLSVGYQGEEGSTKAIYLAQQGALEFSAYESQTEYYNGASIVDSYVVTGMYLYQLPYELQNTDRYNVTNFYDKLVIYAGYARGNADEETSTPVIGGKEKDDNAVTFYYCPHFARTALNPSITSGSINTGNPEKVYIRSARQLNNLGRFPYYWNDNGGATRMTFVQETDVNFGTYTKNYCGRAGYDLMNTSAKVMMNGVEVSVANRPIGEDLGKNTYEQFRNDYDGQTNKIIDYCLDTNAKFAGLFGVIKDGTIKNIVMTVSAEGRGKISSNYLFDGKEYDVTRAGIGALVGYSYKDPDKVKDPDEAYTIENCVAAGYEVTYHQYEGTEDIMPTGVAVGGLIGYCTTNIRNCAAVNDVRYVAHCNYQGARALFIGGFTGSFWNAFMDNVYAGGTIDMSFDNPNVSNGKYAIDNVRIGGLCPGYLNSGGTAYANESATYRNVYTYTDISEHVWDLNGFKYVIPSAGRLQIVNPATTQPTTKMDSPAGYLIGYLNDPFEYHLDRIGNDEDVTQYFKLIRGFLGIVKYPKTCDGISYDGLASIGLTNYEGKDLSGDNEFLSNSLGYEISNLQGKGLDALSKRASYSYPVDTSLRGQNYKFPEFIYRFVKDEDGNIKLDAEGNAIREYVHYGDWPLKDGDDTPVVEEGYGFSSGTVDSDRMNNPPLDSVHNGNKFSYYGGVFYYEIYELDVNGVETIGMYAIGTVYGENKQGDPLITTLSSSKTVKERGMGVFHYADAINISNGSFSVNRPEGDFWEIYIDPKSNTGYEFTEFSSFELPLKGTNLDSGYKFYIMQNLPMGVTLEQALALAGYVGEDDGNGNTVYEVKLGIEKGVANNARLSFSIADIEASRQ